MSNKNLYPENIGDIRILPEYKKLMNMGFIDISTDLVRKNGGLRLAHPILGNIRNPWKAHESTDPQFFQIFQNGITRSFTSPTPAEIKSLTTSTVNTPTEYNSKMRDFRHYFIRLFVKNELKESSRKKQALIGNKDTWEESASEMYKNYPDEIFNFLEKTTTEIQVLFLDIEAENVEDYIIERILADRNKWAEILKKIYKSKAVQRIIDRLPADCKEEYRRDLNLQWGLYILGF